MAETDTRTSPRRDPRVAEVDTMVAEDGTPIEVPDNSTVKQTHAPGAAMPNTGPTNWWRVGLVLMALIIAALLLMQVFGGNPGTDVVPGTPVAAPEVPAPDAAPPAGQ